MGRNWAGGAVMGTDGNGSPHYPHSAHAQKQTGESVPIRSPLVKGLPDDSGLMSMRLESRDDVLIRWRTHGVIAGSVRDAQGIFDVHWASSTGWVCSCSDEYGCHHVAALRQLTDAGAAVTRGVR